MSPPVRRVALFGYLGSGDRLVAQVLAARNAAGELANHLIRLGTASYAAEVESLLECVATEALGLAAWFSQRSL